MTHPENVGAMPALSADSLPKTWEHLYKKSGQHEPRKVKFLDNLATLWRAEWFESIGEFDPDELRGYGKNQLSGQILGRTRITQKHSQSR